jgi:filamentous hemagglutinin
LSFDIAAKDHAVSGSISLTAGFNSQKNQQTSSSSTPVVTTIRAGRSVTIVAESGNLTGRGAQILAGLDANGAPVVSDDPETGNVHLWAKKTVDLESAKATSNSSSDSKSASAAIGIGASFSIGADGKNKNKNSAGLGFTASASGSKGGSTGTSVTEVNSHVIGTGTVSLHSGGDTTLKGAVISGRSVIEDVAGNLFIESLQDLQRYDAKTVSASLSLKSGAAPSGGVNIAKLNGNYANVTEQSGIFAGDGGYHVKVGGNIDLKGGAIASTAPAEDNDLTARSLTFSNIENSSKASASSYGIVLGPGGIPLPVVGQQARQNDHDETLATLSPGHLTLSDQTQDLASLNADLSKANDQALRHRQTAKTAAERRGLVATAQHGHRHYRREAGL